MTTYIGTATSRIDGRAKVTGAAKYAGEFNVPDLAYGSVVEVDHREGPHRAHRHRPSAAGRRRARRAHPRKPAEMADTDKAYQDDVAPERLAVPAAL